MARDRGTFKVSASYEPQITAPFDARALVECKADLMLASTWQQTDGSIWIYDGMAVSVGRDVDANNNGLYVLLDAANYTVDTSWKKLMSSDELEALKISIDDLQEQIDQIEGGTLEINLIYGGNAHG